MNDSGEREAIHRQALRARIHPSSLRELLLFSSVYPDTAEGKSALQQAWKILAGQVSDTPPPLPPDFGLTATTLVHVIEPGTLQADAMPALPKETIALVESIGASLPHRKLKGHSAQTLQEIQTLPPCEIDLARALILLDAEHPGSLTTIEAALDVLALEILARVGKEADDASKIAALTHLLFHELGIRFPPQSEAAEKTEQFSNLSSVLFSRRGVCLGASVLYLALAQRIGVPLSVYTPPGHIFVAHKTGNHIRVIETTARGVDIPIAEYLGLSLKALPERTIKEVIGMVLFNRTSPLVQAQQWGAAQQSYKKALLFDSGDEVYQMLSLCELLNGHETPSQHIALQTLDALPSYRLEPDFMLLDLAQGALSKEGAAAILQHSEAEGEELPKAIRALQDVQNTCKRSLVLPLHLAHAWIAYGKPKEALPILEGLCHRADAPCSIHALLASLYLERMNIPLAWKEAATAVKKAQSKQFLPRPLYHLIVKLQHTSPRCADIPDLLAYRTIQ